MFKKVISMLLVCVMMMSIGCICVTAQTNEELINELLENGVTVHYGNASETAPVEENNMQRSNTYPPSEAGEDWFDATLPAEAANIDFDFSSVSVDVLYSSGVFKPATRTTPLRMQMTTGTGATGVFNIKLHEAGSGSVVARFNSVTVEPAGLSTTKTFGSSYFVYPNEYYISVEHVSGGDYMAMVVY